MRSSFTTFFGPFSFLNVSPVSNAIEEDWYEVEFEDVEGFRGSGSSQTPPS